MKFNYDIYLKRASIVSKQAVKLRDNFRLLSMQELLTYVVQSVNATSAYVCQYYPDKSGYIVVSEYIANRANNKEVLSDLGELYDSDDMGPHMMHWVKEKYRVPRYIYIDDLTPDDPEFLELETYGGKSVAYFGIYRKNEMMGFIEIWHSLDERIVYSADEIRFIQQIADLTFPILRMTDPDTIL